MTRDDTGYWTLTLPKIQSGTRYLYKLDDSVERPDPASFSQPDGVHAPSRVVNHERFLWSDDRWKGRKLDDSIIYELHVGTFTPGGDFHSAVERLSYLADLGINAVEIMPVSQFPGERNWGYDGVYPFAVQNSYGGVDALKSFINESHRHGLSVILDVVYNHLGPEGNYLHDYGPYFTKSYNTPWGESLNFDGAYSDPVCDYFICNALYWLHEFHVDALRLDAVHAIYDFGARPFLQRLALCVEQEFADSPFPRYLIAESDLNDSRVLQKRESGGFGIDAQWSDDFHHSLHTLLTGESYGFYEDFGTIRHLVDALRKGFCYDGAYSRYRKRSHGNSVSDFSTDRFVVFSQNHDMTGNRMLGERLIVLTDRIRARLAAATVLFSPYIPLLFMGEEFGEENPFFYFADHSDPELKRGVREGRKSEAGDQVGFRDPPDPFDPATFLGSRLDWNKLENDPWRSISLFYKNLIRTRKSIPAIRPTSRENIAIEHHGDENLIMLYYRDDFEPAVCLFYFSPQPGTFRWNFDGEWRRRFDTSTDDGTPADETIMAGSSFTLSPYGCVVYTGGGGIHPPGSDV